MPGALVWVPRLTLGFLGAAVLAGLAGTLLPAFGLLPGLGASAPPLTPWADLIATPGIARSVARSVTTGLAATLLSLAIATALLASLHGTRVFAAIRRLLSPLLAVPHAAAALGLAFVLSPSGLTARLLSPWATGWDRPPDLLIVHDPIGLALIAGLVAKEVPFLVLMMLAALPQTDAARSLATARSLGYGRTLAWLKTVFPRLYPQIRLPVYAVLAFSLSNVEVALILGPTTPAPLAVRLAGWMRDPDLALWLKAGAGATLQLVLVLAALGLWRAGERIAAALGRIWLHRGARGPNDAPARALAVILAALVILPLLLGLASLALWSFAGLWPFPAALPETLSPRIWLRAGAGLTAPLVNTALIGAITTAAALALVTLGLEATTRPPRPAPRARGDLLLYLPLIVPQIAFVFGLQVLAVLTGLDGGRTGVILAHLVFVLPYVALSLAGPWAALDPRYAQAAAMLGARPWRIFWTIRLPLLLAPLLTAAAIGFAVSVGLYLPTLLVGAGRVETLTTEAVALASGGDRRLIGVYGLVQLATAAIGFALVPALPALIWRNRRALRP